VHTKILVVLPYIWKDNDLKVIEVRHETGGEAEEGSSGRGMTQWEEDLKGCFSFSFILLYYLTLTKRTYTIFVTYNTEKIKMIVTFLYRLHVPDVYMNLSSEPKAEQICVKEESSLKVGLSCPLTSPSQAMPVIFIKHQLYCFNIQVPAIIASKSSY
jgi:hypothetical protein